MTELPPPDCEYMKSFATSRPLIISLIINLIISFISIFVIQKCAVVLKQSKLFHYNTRFQIFIQLVGLSIHSIGRLWLHIADLSNYLIPTIVTGCEALPNFYRCLYGRLFYNIGVAISFMAPIAIAIERTVTYHNNFNKTANKRHTYWVGRIIGVIQLFLASLFLLSLYSHAATHPSQFRFYYCQTLSSSTGSFWDIGTPLICVFFAQLISFTILIYIQAKNIEERRILQIGEKYELGRRHRVDKTIRSIKALRLFVKLSFVMFFVLSFVLTALHYFAKYVTKPNYMALVEMAHCLPLYSIVASFWMYRKTEKIRENRDREFQALRKISTNAYREQMIEMCSGRNP